MAKDFAEFMEEKMAEVGAGLRDPEKTKRDMKKYRQVARPDPTKQGDGYNGWATWDTWAAWLMIENDEPLYRRAQSAKEMFERKKKAGKFDMELARYYVLQYLVKPAKKQEEDIDLRQVNLKDIVEHVMGL